MGGNVRKLDLTPYTITVYNPETQQRTVTPYPIIQSLEAITSHPQQQLNNHDLLKLARIFTHIRKQVNQKPENVVMLEDSDFNFIQQKWNNFKGLSLNEIPLAQRIRDAPKIEVEEKKK